MGEGRGPAIKRLLFFLKKTLDNLGKDVIIIQV